jgi:hypothetical protein
MCPALTMADQKEMKMRIVAAVLALTICSGATHAEAKPKKEKQSQIRVFVFVASNPNGFIDPGQKERNDSANDLKTYLGKKWMTDKREDANVIVEVTGRGYQQLETLTKTAQNWGVSGNKSVATVYATITAGDYTAKLIGQDDGWEKTQLWKTAAVHAAKKIIAWTQDNHDKLLALRTK